MKKFLLIALMLILLGTCGFCVACFFVGESDQEGVFTKNQAVADSKTLVVYYSQSGNTETVAEMLKDNVDADLYEIKTERAYSSSMPVSVVRIFEEKIFQKMPKLGGELPDLDQYDLIFIGGPIWFSKVSNPLVSWLEASDFTGKTVIPFCTYDGSGVESYQNEIKTLIKNGTVTQEKAFSDQVIADKTNLNTEITQWLNEITLSLFTLESNKTAETQGAAETQENTNTEVQAAE